MASLGQAAAWEEEVKQAKKNLEERSFTVVLDRPVPEGHEIVIIEKLGTEGGRHIYKVAFSDPKKHWY